MGRTDERKAAGDESRLAMLEGDLDRLEAKVGKLLAATSLAATGLLVNALILLLQAAGR